MVTVVMGAGGAVAGSSTAVAAAVSRSASQPTLSGSSVDECTEIKAQAATLAAAGKAGAAACLDRTEKAASTDAGLAAATQCGSSSTLTRTTSCIIEDGLLVIFLVPGGEVVGSVKYTITVRSVVAGNSLRWRHSFTYKTEYVVGDVALPHIAETFIFAEPVCRTGSCRIVSASYLGESAIPTTTRTRSATFETTNLGVGSVWQVSAGWKHRFHNPYWVNGYTAFSYSTPATHRCDNTLGANTSPGCTFPSVRPTLDVPFSRYPTYARHIRLSLYYGLPSVLTRTTNETLRIRNYRTACPTGPNYPRPTGFSCDEYPFQSTYEGAASQPYGRTFLIFGAPLGTIAFNCQVRWLPNRARGDSGGYSSCMVPVGENSLGGRDLQDFYYRYRVIDRDKFVVRAL